MVGCFEHYSYGFVDEANNNNFVELEVSSSSVGLCLFATRGFKRLFQT